MCSSNDSYVPEKDMNNKLLKRIRIEYVVVIALMALCAVLARSRAIWGDEAFSLLLIDNSWGEMVKQAVGDVHPPLYYFILKIMVSLGSLIGISAIWMGKMVSYIPVVLMALVSGRRIVDIIGREAYNIWLMFLVGMANMLYYGIEIRMYSWGMFFVLETFLFGYALIYDKDHEKKNWIGFTVFAALSSYTHYYACLAAVIIYFIVLAYCIKEDGFWKKWIISALICIVCYIPWLIVFLNQFGEVRGEYWIPEITFASIVEIYQFYFEPRMETLHINLVVGLILLVGVMALWMIGGIRKSFVKNGVSIFLISMVVTVLISVMVKPILVPRYLMFAAPLLWMTFANDISLLGNKWVKRGILAVCMLATLINIGQFARWERINSSYYDQVSAYVDSNDIDVIYTDTQSNQRTFKYYYPEKEVCAITDVEYVDEVIGEQLSSGSLSSDNAGHIWYMDSHSGDSEEIRLAIADKLNSAGVEFDGEDKEASFTLEYTNFDIYK